MQPRRRWRLSATVALVALNVIAFCLQFTVLRKVNYLEYLALSRWGLLHGYFWQLLSYQFLHGGLAHIALNCWALFVFGRAVEWTVGKTRFLVVYFSSGIIGGLLQVMACVLWPHYFNGATVGASAGVFGIVACFAMLFPRQPLIMLLFFVLPIKMRAQSLLAVMLIMTGLGIAFPKSLLAVVLGGNVAHFAHLGGMLTGLAFSRFYFLPRLRMSHPEMDTL
ncbi:MAG TPA: rhomboid family intramembrane serine protease [Verrucomicrobiae bacterium]|nr:rhomboid family intramembrane serine protease [Verrucomicrobiae bacterium]